MAISKLATPMADKVEELWVTSHLRGQMLLYLTCSSLNLTLAELFCYRTTAPEAVRKVATLTARMLAAQGENENPSSPQIEEHQDFFSPQTDLAISSC